MSGAIHRFLFATSFVTFSKVILNSLTWLTFSFNCLLISSIHGMFGVLSSLSQSPELDKFFHFWNLYFMCLLSFQHSEESLLVSLKHNIVPLPSSYFFTFCQLFLFVPQLLQPLLCCISQVAVSFIFLNQHSQFLNDLLFLLGCFSPLYPSV